MSARRLHVVRNPGRLNWGNFRGPKITGCQAPMHCCANTDGSFSRFTELVVDKGHVVLLIVTPSVFCGGFGCSAGVPYIVAQVIGQGVDPIRANSSGNLFMVTLCVLFPTCIFGYSRCQSTGHFSTRHFWGPALVLFWTRLTETFLHSLPLGRCDYGLVTAFTRPMIPITMSCPGLSFMWQSASTSRPRFCLVIPKVPAAMALAPKA